MTSKKIPVSIILLIILCLSATVVSASFVGSAKSDKYHYDYCEWGQKIAAHNLIVFPSVADAKNAGYVPCKVCQPPASSSAPTASSAPVTSSAPAAAPADDTFGCWNCNGVSSRSNAKNCNICGWDMCTVCNMCSPSCEKSSNPTDNIPDDDTNPVSTGENTITDTTTTETDNNITNNKIEPINEPVITKESATATTNTTDAEDISNDKSDSNANQDNTSTDTDSDNTSGYIISGILLLGSGYLLKRKFSKK